MIVDVLQLLFYGVDILKNVKIIVFLFLGRVYFPKKKRGNERK